MPNEPVSEAKHETRDVGIRSILIFGVALAGLCAVSGVLLAGLFRWFERQQAPIKESRFPLSVEQRDRLPEAPRLEGIESLLTEGPAWPVKAKPDELAHRIQDAFQHVENLPARKAAPPVGELPSDASSGRGRAPRNDQ